ncbi:MAG: porphobilinogen synthase [Actinomycetia bacterium]|nr:porphobilinogen synthase [Actinomycetes bacterium]
MSSPAFPQTRLRRLRRSGALRQLVRETHLDPSQLVYPLFACEGQGVRQPLDGLGDILHVSVDQLADEVEEIRRLGIGAVLLFGVPAAKDDVASGAYDEDGIVQRGVRALKAAAADTVVITDVCLCAYTSHGHCGLVQDEEILNDLSLELLARTALSHAEAGADIVAPSDMMDGRVGAIRSALDQESRGDVAIMAYSAKYASAFYGPFRDASSSAPAFGDRRTYQLDPANGREAMREIALDIQEGADAVMVKPALAYLDVVASARDRFDLPLAAYNTSGEYAMVKGAAARGWLDERQAALEMLTAIRRAGCDLIITYWAKRAASWF